MALRDDLNREEHSKKKQGLEYKLEKKDNSVEEDIDNNYIKAFNEAYNLVGESGKVPKEMKRYSKNIGRLIQQHKEQLTSKQAALQIVANILGIPEGPFYDSEGYETASEEVPMGEPFTQDKIITAPDTGKGDEPLTVADTQHIKVSTLQMEQLLLKIAELAHQNLILKDYLRKK